MKLITFVQKNRKELDRCIVCILGSKKAHRYRNDQERKNWILNDEGLYNWAKSEGVNI